MVTFLVYSAIIILLPLVPAVILYRFLPSKSSVGGPFKGLSIRLQGAFGGYFLLVLVLSGVLISRAENEGYPRYEEWEVVGKIKFPQEITGDDLKGLRFILVPSRGQTLADKLDAARTQSFLARVPVIRTGYETWEVPYQIMIDHPKLWSITLNPKDEIPNPKLGFGARQQLPKVIEMISKDASDANSAGNGAVERKVARP